LVEPSRIDGLRARRIRAADNTDNTVASRPEHMERPVMRDTLQRLTAAIVALLILAGSTAWAQTTTATQTRTFEVIAVVGNRVVVQEPAGTREYTIPPGFRFTVDGKQVRVSDLKPGMNAWVYIRRTSALDGNARRQARGQGPP